MQSLGGILASVVINVRVELCTFNKLHLMSQVIIMDSFCFILHRFKLVPGYRSWRQIRSFLDWYDRKSTPSQITKNTRCVYQKVVSYGWSVKIKQKSNWFLKKVT